MSGNFSILHSLYTQLIRSWRFLKVIFLRARFWSFWNVVIVSLIFWPHNRLLSKHFSLQPLFPKDWGFFYCLLSQQILISISLEYAFPTHFLTSKHMLSIADKHHFSHQYYGLVILWSTHKISSPKLVHKSCKLTGKTALFIVSSRVGTRTPFWVPPFFWSKFKKLPPSFWQPSKLVHVNCKKHLKMKVLCFVPYKVNWEYH